MNGFNSGLQGTATGSAMNSVGLMYHNAARSASAPASAPAARACAVNEVAWHSEGDCFVPTQVHINIAAASLFVNVVLALALVATWRSLRRGAR